MPLVVTENCINCKHTYCADVCPVDAFAEGTNFLVIDPDECIECGLCEPACIVGAIVDEQAVSAEQHHFIRLNAELAGIWPKIRAGKPPPPDAEEWDGVPGKLALLER